MKYSNKVVLTLEEYEAMKDEYKELKEENENLDYYYEESLTKLNKLVDNVIEDNLEEEQIKRSNSLDDLIDLDNYGTRGIMFKEKLNKWGISDEKIKTGITKYFEYVHNKEENK